MKRYLLFSLIVFVVFALSVGAQKGTGSEDELKAKATELFDAQNFKEAKLMYAQLLSLYPKDPTYNYRFGACVLQTEADKTKPLKYLNFAAGKPDVDPLAYFYLGRAHHLNYEFAAAVKQYSRFKNKASSEEKTKYAVDRQIEMCKNGNQLLSKINEVQVVERQSIAEKDFYRIYDESEIGGKIIVTPEEFKSKYDKKIADKSVIFLAAEAKEVYYSSYGKKGDNGKDIYKAIKLGNGEWSEGVSLGNSINTKFDEDFAFIKPDGVTLYFASKGHSSMGGFDIFKSVLDDATGQWTEPENLDFAFNSADDDFMFVTNQSEVLAYFASNRANEFGEVTVYKTLTERGPAQLSVISGSFIAENNLEQKKAKITVIDKVSQETIGVYETDDQGNYAIEIAKNGGEYQFNIETNETDPIHTGVVSIPEQDEFEVLGQELRLVGSGNEQQLVIKNIFDGTATNTASFEGGPSISSELIKKKANLEVNYNSNDLAALEQKITEEELPEVIEVVAEESPVEDLVSEVEESDVSTEDIVEPATSNVSVVGIENEITQLKAQSNSLVDQKQQAISAQYSAALSLQQQAEELFVDADKMEASGAQSIDVVLKRKDAGEKALKASVAAQLAQELEESINDDLSQLDEIESAEVAIQAAIGENEMQIASDQLSNLKSSIRTSEKLDDVITQALSNIDENNSLADKKIVDFSSKSASFREEKAELGSLLSGLKADAEKANGKKKEEIQQNIEATELDLKDLEYQESVLNDNLREANLSKKSLRLEKEEVLAASNRINSGTDQSTTITEEEREQLFSALKGYRDENQLAFSMDNELYETESEELPDLTAVETTEYTEKEDVTATTPVIDNSNTGAELGEESSGTVTSEIENNTTETEDYGAITSAGIDTKYENEIASTASVTDAELKLANQIRIYDEWLGDLNGKKVEVETDYNAEIDESKRSVLQSELDNITASIREQSKAKSDAESELTTRAAGEFVADLTPIGNVNDITESSIVEDDFTNLKYNQTLGATNPEAAVSLMDAKKALYEAGQIAKQQESAQESAYSLPTPAERTQAFARANQLKKSSEAKQLQAAEKFAVFNLKEYQSNKAKISEANSLDSRYATQGREIAELLSEEAENFFTDAAIIRSEINEDDRLSQKEVLLQKAYDYEVLAIQKQKEALKKLGMVVSEVISAKTGTTPKARKPFIQVIESEEILAVVESPKAIAAAERLKLEANTIDTRIEELDVTIDEMEDGEARDSLITVAEALEDERLEVLEEAALYYERDRQIKAGLVGSSSSNITAQNKVSAPVRPAFVVNLDEVEVEAERKRLLLASQSFTQFANNRQSLVSQTKAGEVTYNEAIALAEENDRLRKQAIIETSMAKVVNEEGEKQRLIKSAQVIESKIKANESKIENLNKTIKVKNFLVQSLAEKDAAYLANISEADKKDYIALSSDFVPVASPITAVEPVNNLASNEEELTVGEVTSEETAEELPELNELTIDDTTLDVPEGAVVDSEDLISDESVEENGEALGENGITTPETIADNIVGGEFAKDGVEGNEPSTSFTEENPSEEVVKEIAEVIAPIATPVKVEEEKIEEVEKPVVKVETPKPVERKVQPKQTPTVGIANIDVVPREVKQAIFVTLERNESAYNENKPIPTNASMPDGLVYKVQVGAFRNAIPASTFKGFAPLMSEQAGNGITRYTAGLFANESTAGQAKTEIRKLGYPDAFVVAFLNGKRVSMSVARNNGGGVAASNTPANFPKVSAGGGTVSGTQSLTPVASAEEVTQVSGGSKEALPEVFNSKEIEEVVNTKTIEGVYYTIQIGVFSTPIKKGVFDYDGLNIVQLSNGLYRYNAGIFNSVLAAAELKNTINETIKDAFVTAYYDGKRVTLTEASKLKNQ